MSKVISSLSVVLGATVAPLVSGFKQAEAATQGLTSSLLNIAAPIASLEVIGGALGSVLNGFGLGPMLKEQSEAIDSSAKLSDRLGIATESLAGLQHAGALAGVSNEQLTGGVEKMLKTLGEAVTVGGTAAGAFTEIGLNAQRLANEAPSTALSEIADRLKGIENPAQRAADACAIFGKSGQELLPLLMSGSEGIAAATKEAGALGLTFSRLDAAKVEAANDAMTRVGEAIMGVERQFVVALSPAIQAAADMLTGWGESAVSVVQTYLPGIANITAAAFDGVTSVIRNAWSAVYSFTAPIVSSIVDWVGSHWQGMVDNVVPILSAYVGVVESEFVAIWDGISAAASGISSAWDWAMNALGVSSGQGATTAGGWMDRLGGAAKYLSDGIALSFNTAAFAFRNFGAIAEFVVVSAAAGWVTFYNQIGYGITDVIGGYLTWLGTNWKNIFTDMVHVTESVFSNLLTNAKNFGAAIWHAIKGEGFEFQWTSLTEGFKSTLTALPQIADRQMGPIEQSLHDQAAAMGQNIAIGYSDFLKRQADAAKTNADRVKDAVGGAADWLKGAFKHGPEVPTPVINPPKPVDVNTDPAKKSLDGLKQKAQDLKPVLAGSAEAMQLRYFAMAEAHTAQAADAEASAQLIPQAAPVLAPLPASAYPNSSSTLADGNAVQQLITLLQPLVLQMQQGRLIVLTNDANPPEMASI